MLGEILIKKRMIKGQHVKSLSGYKSSITLELTSQPCILYKGEILSAKHPAEGLELLKR